MSLGGDAGALQRSAHRPRRRRGRSVGARDVEGVGGQGAAGDARRRTAPRAPRRARPTRAPAPPRPRRRRSRRGRGRTGGWRRPGRRCAPTAAPMLRQAGEHRRVIPASVPPATTTSASPAESAAGPRTTRGCRSRRRARWRSTGPCRPRSIATSQAAMLGIVEATKKGLTAFGPLSSIASMLSSVSGVPATAQPKVTPARSAIGSRSRPASATASRAATIASCEKRAERWARFGPRCATGSKPFTSPAIRVGRRAGVEVGDRADAGLAGEQRAPGRGRVEADRRQRADARHDGIARLTHRPKPGSLPPEPHSSGRDYRDSARRPGSPPR